MSNLAKFTIDDRKQPVERQRIVYTALAEEMGRDIHALSMQTLTPAQWEEERQ